MKTVFKRDSSDHGDLERTIINTPVLLLLLPEAGLTLFLITIVFYKTYSLLFLQVKNHFRGKNVFCFVFFVS